jgi:transcriptional regulator with XRE-family HTH domain
MNDAFGMVDDTTHEPSFGEVLAANVRRLRVARRLSLSELARATGIGKATLSAVEHGNGNPTVGTLTLLAGALRVRLAELVEEPLLGEVRIVRARRESPDANGLWTRTIDTFGAEGLVELLELSLPPRFTHELEPRRPGTREELLVLAGSVIAGPVERISELAGGDYASFPADLARTLETGRQAADVLLLVHGT